jgi:outer membrane receptor for Fe3+-dicitrate
MIKKTFLNIVLLSSFTSLYAENAEDMNDFQSLLENVSDLATKKSLNVDYMPSVVSIIDAQTYVDAGIQNVGEALGMLPGIQMQLSPMGYSMATVRGFKNPNAYLSDKIKILIDGVAINNEVAGSGDFYGTVNIITKLGNTKEENRIFLIVS